MKHLVIAVLVVGPIAVALAVYIGLVRDGTVPPPNLDLIAEQLRLGTTTTAQVALVLFIGATVLMAVLAPIIYALRSHDPVTVLISLAMTGGAIAILLTGRTVIDQTSALILYLANITLSAI